MRSWWKNALLRKALHDLKASYWFIPAAMTLAALLLAVAAESVDRRGWSTAIPELFYSTEADAVRSVMSLIASAAIGTAGVMFSMTIVAVSFASTNFGPRLIGNFMQDRVVQVSLGTLLATFVFALMILRSLRSGDGGLIFVPALSMTLALVLALLSVAVMIVFIHHIPERLSLENVTARLGRSLLAAALGLPRSEAGAPEADDGAPAGDWIGVALDVTGYVQAVNAEALAELVARHALVLDVDLWPGDFAAPHKPAARIRSESGVSEALAAQIRGCFAVGIGRTEAQNPMFLAQQLAEIVARALSPGVNDPVTAITCLNWLHATLHALATRGPVEPAAGAVGPVLGFLGILDVTHRFLRPYISTDPGVTLHGLALLDALIADLPDGPRREAARAARVDLIAEAQGRSRANPEIAALRTG